MEWLTGPLQSHSRPHNSLRHERMLPVSAENAARTIAWVRVGVTVLSPLLPLLSVVILWAASLPMVDLNRMDDLGLVSTLPVWTFVALFALTISYSLFVFRRNIPEPILLLYVVVLIIMIHGTPQILYGTLRYSWAWKHVGIVDYIQRHGSVDPNIAYLAGYHNWPGFFAFNALITEVTGLGTALNYAGWGPVFYNLIDVGALLLLLRSLTSDRRLIWLSVWIFYLTNWIGQDYFSPQATAYFLYLIVLGILLRWFRQLTVAPVSAIQPWVRSSWVATQFHGLLERVVPDRQPDASTSPLGRVGLMAIVIISMFAIISSHQLTPFMLLSALGALVVFQITSARSLPVLSAVMTVAWIVYLAAAFLNGNLYWIVDSIGALMGNFQANLINIADVSPGQAFVALMDRTLSGAIWFVAIIGAIRRLSLGHWDLPAALLAVSPFPILVMNSYGGEMVFRVYFFGLPFVAFFAASLLYPDHKSGRSWHIPLITACLTCVLLVGFLFAYYGKDRQYYFRPTEVAAAQYVLAHAPVGSLLLDASWDWPLEYKNYEFYQYQSIEALTRAQRLALIDDPAPRILAIMKPYPAAYFSITRSQEAFMDATGFMPPGTMEAIKRALLASPDFKVVLQNPDAVVFTLAQDVNGAGK